MLNTKLFEEEMEKINFSIDIQDIEGIPTEMGRKLVRTDTDTPLGITVTPTLAVTFLTLPVPSTPVTATF